MNKKTLMIAVALMAVVMLTTPVFADPTQGQKGSITINWTRTDTETVDQWWSDGVRHRHVHVEWYVDLVIDGGPPLPGTGYTERDAVRVMQEDGPNNLLNDYYVLTFADGTFEGNALLMIQNGGSPTARGRAHGLFVGTGDFEGQTINAGHDWVQLPVAEIVWTGYLLKPSP